MSVESPGKENEIMPVYSFLSPTHSGTPCDKTSATPSATDERRSREHSQPEDNQQHGKEPSWVTIIEHINSLYK